MKAFVHPHVMGILGICLAGQVPYIVMPFMSNGNLHTYLRKYRNELLISEDEDVDLVYLIALHFIIAFIIESSGNYWESREAWLVTALYGWLRDNFFRIIVVDGI